MRAERKRRKDAPGMRVDSMENWQLGGSRNSRFISPSCLLTRFLRCFFVAFRKKKRKRNDIDDNDSSSSNEIIYLFLPGCDDTKGCPKINARFELNIKESF